MWVCVFVVGCVFAVGCVGAADVVFVERGDAFYANATLDWNQGLGRAHAPLFVAYATSTRGVQAAVAECRARGVLAAVRAGRHSYVDFSVGPDGSYGVIDVWGVRGLGAVECAPLREAEAPMEAEMEACSVEVGAGEELLDVYAHLAAAAGGRYVLAGGSCPTVGAGFFLGGGWGFLARRFGLGADQLVDAELVLANASVVRAAEHPDLLWALRGAGNGNFGVVTRLWLRVHPADDGARGASLQFALSWPLPFEDAWLAFDRWQRIAADAPRRASVNAIVRRSTFEVYGQLFASTDEDALRAVLAPLLAIGSPALTVQKFASYFDALIQYGNCGSLQQCLDARSHQPFQFPPEAWSAKSLYVRWPLGRDAFDAMRWFMTTGYRDADAGFAGLMMDPYGGAVADVATHQTAFPHRDAMYHIQFLAYWHAENVTQREDTIDWLRAMYRNVTDTAGIASPPPTYRNYPDLDLAEPLLSYYGDNLPRLRAIKATLDPLGFFHYAQSL